MKYIIMCGGNYQDKFITPKPLLKVCGEILVERTIRLLRENGITDIAISTNNPAFDYLEVEKLRHQNNYVHANYKKTQKHEESWLNAYYPTEEPACYLAGDVYYSDEAIKTIVNTKVKETMFFCVPDVQDGRKDKRNTKGREPLAYKVENQEIFRKAINELFDLIDQGKFKIDPISWHLYRKINNLGLGFEAKDYGYANDIFKTNGDFIAIDDYTTDIDGILDITRIEFLLNKGGGKMIKVEVIEGFTLGDYKLLKNVTRRGAEKEGQLFIGDTFECDEAMVKYLTGENRYKKPYVKVIEVLPEEMPELPTEEPAKVEEEKAKDIVVKFYEEKPKPKKKKTSKK